VLRRIDNGEVGLREFCRTSGISRYAVQSWRRIEQGKVMPKVKKCGRPLTKQLTTIEELRIENERLQMENELLRSFLQAAGRK